MTRLFLVGDGDTLDAIAELAGRLHYDAISRSDDAPDALDPSDQVVIECRDRERARMLLAQVIGAGDPGYVGLCGDENDALVTLLKLSADRVPKAKLDRVAAPAGLAIFAAGVDERAIAVVAQLIAVRRAPKSPPRASA